MNSAPLAYIAMGSNLGQAEAFLCAASKALEVCLQNPQQLSKASLWKSNPVNCPPGSPQFLNTVVSFPWHLSSNKLLLLCQEIEYALGRRRTIANAPRQIDLDILLLGEEQSQTDKLTLPHPRMEERRFVIEPLTELNPQLILPSGNSTSQLRTRLAQVYPNGIWKQEPSSASLWHKKTT